MACPKLRWARLAMCWRRMRKRGGSRCGKSRLKPNRRKRGARTLPRSIGYNNGVEEGFAVLTGIIAVAIGLGVMVLVHEWGHFVIARLFGVRVEVFSIGFGPRLFGVRRGPTDYRLSALPLGGYVRMAGDNPAEER